MWRRCPGAGLWAHCLECPREAKVVGLHHLTCVCDRAAAWWCAGLEGCELRELGELGVAPLGENAVCLVHLFPCRNGCGRADEERASEECAYEGVAGETQQ
jgi:hypothetical protein